MSFNFGLFEWLVLTFLFGIAAGVYRIEKQIKNYYRICRPIIEGFYSRNPDAKIPRDE
jgi:hypothetical protein